MSSVSALAAEELDGTVEATVASWRRLTDGLLNTTNLENLTFLFQQKGLKRFQRYLRSRVRAFIRYGFGAQNTALQPHGVRCEVAFRCGCSLRSRVVAGLWPRPTDCLDTDVPVAGNHASMENH